jgi:hypothetical protein
VIIALINDLPSISAAMNNPTFTIILIARTP